MDWKKFWAPVHEEMRKEQIWFKGNAVVICRDTCSVGSGHGQLRLNGSACIDLVINLGDRHIFEAALFNIQLIMHLSGFIIFVPFCYSINVYCTRFQDGNISFIVYGRYIRSCAI